MSTLVAERRDPSRCIKYSPCEKIVPSCVSRFILIPVIHDAPEMRETRALFIFRFVSGGFVVGMPAGVRDGMHGAVAGSSRNLADVQRESRD